MRDATSDAYRSAAAPLGALVALYVAYLGAGAIGARLVEFQLAAIFWPPVGVLLAALLSAPRARWAACLAVAGLAELTWNAFDWHNPLPLALVYYAGNALETVAAAVLIRRLHAGPFRFETLHELGAFMLAVAFAPLVSATVIATTNSVVGKSAFAETWRLAWIGDATGLLVATPVALVALDAWRNRDALPRPPAVELVALAGGIAAVLALARSAHLPALFGALPLVLWAALRFQLRGAALSLAVLTVAAICVTPFGLQGGRAEPHATGMMLPAMLGLAAILGVLVGTLSLERRRALRAVEAANAELEARIEARTAELHARERELEAALHVAGETERRKDEFLAMLGHELRNPLAPIRNVVALLARTAGDHPSIAQIVPMMDRQVTQMTRLVDDLLDVARIAQGRLHVHVDEAAIDDVVEHALESVQPLLTARQQRVSVVREVVDARVRGDAGRLAQCVANLLTNAAKYSEIGSEIQLGVRGGEDAIEIVVRDSGSGIAPDLLPHVFKPFVQGPRTLDRSDGGLGVGLAVVGRVIELHGGAVSADSDGVGQGSTFTIRLPRARPASIPERRARADRRVG